MQGEHLFDTMDDGTEIAAPIYREDSSNTVTDERSHDAVEDSELERVHSRWELFHALKMSSTVLITYSWQNTMP